MKQRRQYIGKPPVHTQLSEYERRILAMERAGVTPTNKVTYTSAPPYKRAPDNVPNPKSNPKEQPPIPVGFNIPAVLWLWDSTYDFYDTDFPFTEDLYRTNGQMLKYESPEWTNVNSAGLPIYNASNPSSFAPAIQSLAAKDNHIWFVVKYYYGAFFGDYTYKIYHGLATESDPYEEVYPLDLADPYVISGIAIDARGRLCAILYDNSLNAISFMRSTNGLTAWNIISSIADVYADYDDLFGPNFKLACHPSNEDIIALKLHTGELDAENVIIAVSVDAGVTWVQHVLTVEGEIFHYTDGDICICKDGTIVVQDSVEYNDGSEDEIDDGYHRPVFAWYLSLVDGVYEAPVRTDPQPDYNEDDFGQVSALAVFENIVFFIQWKDHYHLADPFPDNENYFTTKISRSDDSGHTWSDLTEWVMDARETFDYNNLPGYPAGMHYDDETGDLWVVFKGGPFQFNDPAQPRIWKVDSEGNKSQVDYGSISAGNGYGMFMGPSG